jgi:hypothetical protein
MRLLLASALALAAVGGFNATAFAGDPPADPPNTRLVSSPAPTPEDAAYLRAGSEAPVRLLDKTLGDEPVGVWIARIFGSGVPVRWELNDCGETSGSPADSGRDIPVCAQASVVLSGGRELYIWIAVGTSERGVVGPPEFAYAGVEGPDTSLWFPNLSDVERFVERERPVIGGDRLYLDDRRNVHVVTSAGKDVVLTKEGKFRDPKQSPDGRTIGMLVTTKVSRPGAQTYEPIEVADELWIYRGGRVVLRLDPPAYIRTWDFTKDGNSVATYSGALHFAGFYELYDIESGTRLDRSADPVTERSPAWVRAIAP